MTILAALYIDEDMSALVATMNAFSCNIYFKYCWIEVWKSKIPFL